VLATLLVLVPFCYLAGAFAVAPVVERQSQAAHIQLLSGCPMPLYWAGSFVRPRPCPAEPPARRHCLHLHRVCILPVLMCRSPL